MDSCFILRIEVRTARSAPVRSFFLCPRSCEHGAGVGACSVEHAERAPRSALAKTPCADGAVRSFFLCPRSCEHGAGVGACSVEHAERAPPFGTRKNALRRWRRSVFFLMSALVRARRGHEAFLLVGAGGRTRTDTDFTPQDFESSASASFTTPAQITIYHSAGELTSVFATARNVLQDVSCRRREGRKLRGERGAGRVAENFEKMCGLAYANLLTKGERAAYNSGVKSE